MEDSRIKFRALRGEKTWWYSSDEGIYFKDGCLYEFDEFDDINIGIAYQFTGLFDKQGVEIYEGDVLKLSRCDEGRIYFDLFYGVSWDAPSFFIHTLHYLCNKERKRAVKEKRISEAGSAIYYNGGLDIYSSRNLAVIGNFYENPELLEERK